MNIFKTGNFLALQTGWFITCYFSGIGYPYIGPCFTLLWLVIHFYLVNDKFIDLRIVLSAALFGYIFDSSLVLYSIIGFPEHARFGMPATLWMVALWINFALTLRHSMAWLRNRYLLAMTAGAVFGPLAYFAGEQFSAIVLADGLLTIGVIAGEWIIAMLFLLWITEKSESEHGYFQQFILKSLSR